MKSTQEILEHFNTVVQSRMMGYSAFSIYVYVFYKSDSDGVCNAPYSELMGIVKSKTSVANCVKQIEKCGLVRIIRSEIGNTFFVNFLTTNNADKIYNEIIKKPAYGVYIIRCENHYKIGVSKNPHTRIRKMKTGSPLQFNIEHFSMNENAFLIEKELHNIYKEKRVTGEWFDLSDKDVKQAIDYIEKKR